MATKSAPFNPKKMRIEACKLRFDESLLCRQTIDYSRVDSVARDLRRIDTHFPPLAVYEKKGELFILDGYYRWLAAMQFSPTKMLTVETQPCEQILFRRLFANRINAIRLDLNSTMQAMVKNRISSSDDYLAWLLGCTAGDVVEAKLALPKRGSRRKGTKVTNHD